MMVRDLAVVLEETAPEDFTPGQLRSSLMNTSEVWGGELEKQRERAGAMYVASFLMRYEIFSNRRHRVLGSMYSTPGALEKLRAHLPLGCSAPVNEDGGATEDAGVTVQPSSIHREDEI